MQNIVLSISLFIFQFGNAQVSYEFMQPLPPESARINSVDKTLHGIYKSDSSDIVFEINSAGIYTRNLVIHSISRETVRETSKYQVKGDYIFGIAEADSLPCVLDGENYYFGVTRRDTLINMMSKNELRKLSANEYILNFYENGSYTPCLLRLESGKLSIKYFDYSTDTNPFALIKTKQSKTEAEGTYVYLLPTLKEWKKIDSKLIFGQAKEFKLQTSR
jgi:hypothetical protein